MVHFIPVDTGRKLNVHNTFRRRPGRLLNVVCTFSSRPLSTGMGISMGYPKTRCWQKQKWQTRKVRDRLQIALLILTLPMHNVPRWFSHFMSLVFFYTLWKQKTLGFLMVFNGYRKRPVTWNQLVFWCIAFADNFEHIQFVNPII